MQLLFSISLPLVLLFIFLSCKRDCFVFPHFCFAMLHSHNFIFPNTQVDFHPCHLHNSFLFPATCVTSSHPMQGKVYFPAISHLGWLLFLFVLPIVHFYVVWIYSGYCLFSFFMNQHEVHYFAVWLLFLLLLFPDVFANCQFCSFPGNARLFCFLLCFTQVGCCFSWLGLSCFWYFFLPLPPLFSAKNYYFFVFLCPCTPQQTHARSFFLCAVHTG